MVTGLLGQRLIERRLRETSERLRSLRAELAIVDEQFDALNDSTGEARRAWAFRRGLPMRCDGSSIISFHCAIHPTVRATVKRAGNIDV